MTIAIAVIGIAVERAAVQAYPRRPKKVSLSPCGSVSNTIVSDNTGSGHDNPFGTGILVRPTGSAVVTGVLSKVTVNNNSLRGMFHIISSDLSDWQKLAGPKS
jgi:hypothetical protein